MVEFPLRLRRSRRQNETQLGAGGGGVASCEDPSCEQA